MPPIYHGFGLLGRPPKVVRHHAPNRPVDLLSLAAIAVFAKPYLAEIDEILSDELAAHRAAKDRKDKLIQAERDKVKAAPPLKLQQPAIANTDPWDVFEPVVTAEELADLDARNQEALREMRERADAVRRVVRQEGQEE